jgi:UDP-glucose:(heptosyl)LPS alpha-1,3-glucosyltransferase
MRVIQIIRGFGPAGGASRVAYELHRRLLRRGIDSLVLTGKLSGAVETEGDSIQLLAHPIVRLEDTIAPLRRLVLVVSVPLFTLLSTIAVRRMRGPSDIVISHGDSLAGDIVIMHSVHRAAMAAMMRSGRYAPLLNPLHWWIFARNRFLFRRNRSRRIVVVGSRLKREMLQYYDVGEETLVHIPNGIDTETFSQEATTDRVQVRTELGIPLRAKVALFAGHEFRRKGLEHVVRAASISSARPHVLVVGSDSPAPFRGLIRSLGLEDRVFFAGHRPDMPRMYGASDVLILPTLYESFALVCIEAMATGLPVIATRVGGVEDYLIDGVNGFLTERDPDEIARHIDRLFTSPNVYHRVSAAAAQRALEYSWNRIADRYIDLIETVYAERLAAGKNP